MMWKCRGREESGVRIVLVSVANGDEGELQ
jgi:hypothetical protein